MPYIAPIIAHVDAVGRLFCTDCDPEVMHENNSMLWPERRRVSDAVLVTWAQDAIDNGQCTLNPAPTLAELQCNPALARKLLEDAGLATFRAALSTR